MRSRGKKADAPVLGLRPRCAVGALRSPGYLRAHNAGRVRATGITARLRRSPASARKWGLSTANDGDEDRRRRERTETRISRTSRPQCLSAPRYVAAPGVSSGRIVTNRGSWGGVSAGQPEPCDVWLSIRSFQARLRYRLPSPLSGARSDGDEPLVLCVIPPKALRPASRQAALPARV